MLALCRDEHSMDSHGGVYWRAVPTYQPLLDDMRCAVHIMLGPAPGFGGHSSHMDADSAPRSRNPRSKEYTVPPGCCTESAALCPPGGGWARLRIPQPGCGIRVLGPMSSESA